MGYKRLRTTTNLPSVLRLCLLESLFDFIEEHLNRLQEGTVLRCKHQAATKLGNGIVYSLAFVDSCIIHVNHNSPSFVLWVFHQCGHDSIKEVLKKGVVDTLLNHLRPHHFVLRHGCKKSQSVLGPLFRFHMVCIVNHG